MRKNFDIYIDSEQYALIPRSLQDVFMRLVVRSEYVNDILLSYSYCHFVVARCKKKQRQDIARVIRLLNSQAQFYYKDGNKCMHYSACNRLACNLLDSLI